MTESAFKKVFAQFLNGYWGAFHEALEAQSVTPQRLASSLFEALQSEHRSFEAMYVGSAKNALADLGRIWHDLEARRYRWPDAALSQEDITDALRSFGEIYDSLTNQGQGFSAALKDILRQAPHGSPRDRLRADAAR
jgi:hypothetical protein